TRDQLGAALWPDQPAHQLGNSLHTALRGLRRALGGSDWVVYSDRRYSFTTSREYDCDVATFELALAAARKARDGEAALRDLQRAIAAYGGDFLAGLAAGEWAQARRDELRRSFESALLAAGRLHGAAGRHQDAAADFPRAIAHEPLNETTHPEPLRPASRHGAAERDGPPRADGRLGQPRRNRPRHPALLGTRRAAGRPGRRPAVSRDNRAVPAAARPPRGAAAAGPPPRVPPKGPPTPPKRRPAGAQARLRVPHAQLGPASDGPD